MPIKLHCRNYDLKKKLKISWCGTLERTQFSWTIFLENKMCFIDSFKICMILCAVGKP